MTMNHGLAFRCISMPISSMVGVEDKSNYYCIVGTKRSDASDIPDQAVAWERYNLMNFQRSSHLCKTMAHAVASLDQPSNYKDSQARLDRGRQAELLSKSTTLYVC